MPNTSFYRGLNWHKQEGLKRGRYKPPPLLLACFLKAGLVRLVASSRNLVYFYRCFLQRLALGGVQHGLACFTRLVVIMPCLAVFYCDDFFFMEVAETVKAKQSRFFFIHISPYWSASLSNAFGNSSRFCCLFLQTRQ